MSNTDETDVVPGGPSGPIPRKPWHKRRWVRITGAIVGGLLVISALTNHSGSSQAAATVPAKPTVTAPAKPTVTAPAKSATPKAQAPKATPKPAKPAAPAAPASPAQAAPAVAAPAQPSTPAPAQTTQPSAPPAATTPASCSPLSNRGTCYEPGEYCRNADHGASGMAGDGEAITCEYNNGWRWEPA